MTLSPPSTIDIVFMSAGSFLWLMIYTPLLIYHAHRYFKNRHHVFVFSFCNESLHFQHLYQYDHTEYTVPDLQILRYMKLPL